jgi:hypothetical protein
VELHDAIVIATIIAISLAIQDSIVGGIELSVYVCKKLLCCEWWRRRRPSLMLKSSMVE